MAQVEDVSQKIDVWNMTQTESRGTRDEEMGLLCEA